jgi:hypothetical protein
VSGAVSCRVATRECESTTFLTVRDP